MKADTSIKRYTSLAAAARGLLGEATAIVSEVTPDFVVVGGWSAFLLNGSPIKHPGSFDVDLLFKSGATKQSLDQVVEALIRRGYMYSAKHRFQVLRILCVGQERFVFNVDLLHPSESKASPEMFVDHLVLPVLMSEFAEERAAVRSIVMPASDFLFDGHALRHPLTYARPDGQTLTSIIPLMDELGTLVSKAESMLIPKRTRDAFDVYLALQQRRPEFDLSGAIRRLPSKHSSALDQLRHLWEFERVERLRANVAHYHPMSDSKWDAFLNILRSLLEGCGVARPPNEHKGNETATTASEPT